MASARAANIGGGVAVVVAIVVGDVVLDDSGFGVDGSRMLDGGIGGSGCISCPKIDFPNWMPLL